MAQIPEKVKELFKKQQTFVIATSSKEGVPNAVPMGTVKMLDDETIVISNQFWKKTLQNLSENPEIAITFWEGFKGYQIKGDCELMTEGKVFEETAASRLRDLSELVHRYGRPWTARPGLEPGGHDSVPEGWYRTYGP